MSRSKAKHPKISWVCYFSNKKDKRIANRLFRRISKIMLKQGKEPLHVLKECSDTYNFDSDGLPHPDLAIPGNCTINCVFNNSEDAEKCLNGLMNKL